MIPEDWDIKNIGNISDVKTGPFGTALHEKDYVDNGTPIITVEHLGEYGVDHSNLPMVSDEDKKRLKSYTLKVGDIAFSRVGSIDRNALIRKKEDGWLFSGRLLRVRVNNEKYDSRYLSHYFHSESFKQRIRGVAVGQTMPSLNTAILKGVKVVLPEMVEQTTIANALSDADALIQSLTRLIAKKRQIKQAAMQTLLNPYENGRLKAGWVVKKLGDVAPLQRGFDLPNSQLRPGQYPIVYSNGILNYHSKKQVSGPGVITGRSGTLGAVHYVEMDYWPHNTTLWVTNFFGNDPRFIYYLFKRIGFSRFGTGSGVPTLNRNDAHSFVIGIPKQITEQTRIATILSDMDAEIAALEAKLAKYRHIKQGMMQNLLTGRIRLVKPESNTGAIA